MSGLTGLQNLGNTCFLNSAMQCFSHTYELNDILDDPSVIRKIKSNTKGSILKEWNELRKLMWSKDCIIGPGGFVGNVQRVARQIGNDQFIGWGQNDIQEYILFVMDAFHTALAREVTITVTGKTENNRDRLAKIAYETIKLTYTKDYSELIPLFYGIQLTSICSVDGKEEKSVKADPFFMVDLPIPNKLNPTFYDCFDLFVEKEILSGEDQWYNDKTKQKETVMKHIQFWNLPTLLIVDLKRFNKINFQKNNVYVDIPLDNVDLTKYVIGYQGGKHKYELYGVCNHGGNVRGGHYTATIKTKQGWHHFNDRIVTKIKDTSKIVTPMAYCLFFRKKK